MTSAHLAYILCAVTSGIAALLLLRSYASTRARLLLWSGLCFVFMMLENIHIFIDLALTPSLIDLRLVRLGFGLFGVLCLLFGLIWETET